MSLSKQEEIILNKLLAKLDNEQRKNLFQKLNFEIQNASNENFTIEECPYCHSKHIIKKGKNNKNIQRYQCKDCKKFFRVTYNTILFKTRKDLNIWSKYIECMIDKRPLREIEEICDISLQTSFEWRHKILDLLSKMMDDIKLDGIVESDETYTRVSYKGNHTKSKKFIMPRPAHRSGGEVHTRGLSKEQVCISCFISDKNLSYSKVANLGQPSWNKIYKVINKHIEKGSILVTDNYKGYTIIVDKLKLNHISMPQGEYSNGTFNIQKINSYHSYFKDLINHNFRGVSTKYLNNYIVYYNFLHCGQNKRSKKILDLQDYIFKVERNDLIKGNNRPAIPA